ncbi:hypothetical protein AAZX31_02G168100 [Glycine max]|uniref:Uncharacterized protein n=2 Tax=Glycine subgen. Soja TaxID=1462606 RepID=I1JG54_SOYBN|nr:uncharacterized protein LOC100780040 [Glycine max]XP_028209506.1 uncharacterized protein LOC114392534 [Glycine soja]KAG5052210.1 hypothetical protein JHK87_004408 [Glycine soja]KAG5080506.1 hypothetical protein JHK86_004571 [Glycine max]KAH1060880.1 hypothetical protein GYH30_004380 [Glycine max]KHN24601.1 hypothetical protein glysoja_042865 [Glycine soja]KRH71925.1 hypothetical protein GLYMA_02G178400v4 [Glycine max]|eukprot:XP_003519059.1 uncharacterized protein LOC100780040 [Glycine max]
MPCPSSHLRTSHPAPSSSALSSMKLKSLIHTLIVSHMCRIIRAFSKVKAVIVEILKGKKNQSNINFLHHHKKQKMTKKIIFGSFRLHYNWCSSKSSHVIPVPSRVFEGLPKASDTHHDEQYLYEDCHDDDLQLAGYLQWLEEKVHDDKKGSGNEMNEIDKLAELFIADCHEKFKLEKQDSDRRFHEMMARGM